MSNPKIVTSFSKLSDSEFIKKTRHILTSMDSNVNFSTPTPTLPIIKTATDDFEKAMEKAIAGNKSDTAEKNKLRTELQELMTDLGLYVQLNGKKSESILLSSGFDLQKQRVAVGLLDKPTGVSVEPGKGSGSLKVSLDAMDDANSYLFVYTEAPVKADSVWLPIPSTKASTVITDLVSGKQYAFKVAGVGSDPTRVFSDVVLSFVM